MKKTVVTYLFLLTIILIFSSNLFAGEIADGVWLQTSSNAGQCGDCTIIVKRINRNMIQVGGYQGRNLAKFFGTYTYDRRKDEYRGQMQWLYKSGPWKGVFCNDKLKYSGNTLKQTANCGRNGTIKVTYKYNRPRPGRSKSSTKYDHLKPGGSKSSKSKGKPSSQKTSKSNPCQQIKKLCDKWNGDYSGWKTWCHCNYSTGAFCNTKAGKSFLRECRSKGGTGGCVAGVTYCKYPK